MGGDITARSDPGVGSSFRFTFEAKAVAPVQVLTATAEPVAAGNTPQDARDNARLNRARVLLVDDNAVNRKVIKLFLTPFRIDFCEAENGHGALDALRREPFDLVLLDIHMPVMDGCETVKAIRASGEPWRDLLVLALTADAMSGDKERYLSIGMNGYVAKPVDRLELISAMSAALAQAAPSAGERGPMPPIAETPARSAGGTG